MRIVGLKRTKSDIVVEQIKDVLTAKTLVELINKLGEANTNLNALNLFKSVKVVLDTDKRSKNRGGGKRAEEGEQLGKKEKAEVTFLLKESCWYSVAVGAEGGTQSGGAVSF